MHKLIDLEAGSFLLVNKPRDWTSFDVVNKIRYAIRRAFNLKKIKVGHAGTLDPAATGLLIICVGRMTKQIERFQGLKKTYRGIIYLGAKTASYDSETPIETTATIEHLTDEVILSAASEFTGEIMQVPPMYSAIKKDGIRLYKLARKKQKVEVAPRHVFIERFDITKIDLPHLHFEVVCSKGTYIRSLASDLGDKLGCGAYLAELERTAIGDYHLDASWELDQLITQINHLSHEHSS